MREYESIYVLSPEVTDQAAKSFMMKMKELVNKEGGKSLKVDCWGRKKICWERAKHTRGIYVCHNYLGNPGLVAEYERTLAIEEACILRHSVLLAKDVDPSSREEQADQLEILVVRERRDSPRFNPDSDRGFQADRGSYDAASKENSAREVQE